MKSGILNIVALLAMTILSACSSSVNEVEEEHGHGEHEEGESATVSITQMQAETIGLELGPIKSMPLKNSVRVTGILELFPQDRAELSPLISGNIKSIHVIEGDQVNRGQLLATLEHPDFIQMQQDLQIRYNALDYLKLDYERQEKLYKEKVSSAKVYQEAKSEYLSAQAEVNGFKAKLEMLGLNVSAILKGELFTSVPITAPISGYVHLVNVNIGEFASTEMGRTQVMFEITDNSRLHADFRVYEKDVFKVEVGQRITFTVANQPGMILEASISSVGQAFEDDPKSVHVHAQIENPEHKLLPGMYIEGRIAIGDNAVLAVPEDAIVTEGESAFIFVQSENEEEHGHEAGEQHGHTSTDEHGHAEVGEKITFKKVEVVPGIQDAGYVEIKLFEPLPKNTLIALVGAYILSSEMIKGELAHEH